MKKFVEYSLQSIYRLETAEKIGFEALSSLARSDAFTAAGQGIDSLLEVTQVYEAGVKALEGK
jgi:hypothetical protein